MLVLARDWLLDPLALVFLFSTVTAVVLWLLLRHGYSNRYGRSGVTNPDVEGLPSASKSRALVLVVCVLWLGMYSLVSAPYVVNGMIRSMEQPYRAVDCLQGSHIVVLGAGLDSGVETAQDFSSMRHATFIRATRGAEIALAEPDTRVVLAGGALRTITEADVMAEYYMALGIGRQRMILETQSTRTRENAVYVVESLAKELVTGPVRLITSALHMPRALASFQEASKSTDTTFCPVAVDFQGVTPAAYAWMPQTTTIVKFDLWFHEFMALQMYRLRGWL